MLRLNVKPHFYFVTCSLHIFCLFVGGLDTGHMQLQLPSYQDEFDEGPDRSHQAVPPSSIPIVRCIAPTPRPTSRCGRQLVRQDALTSTGSSPQSSPGDHLPADLYINSNTSSPSTSHCQLPQVTLPPQMPARPPSVPNVRTESPPLAIDPRPWYMRHRSQPMLYRQRSSGSGGGGDQIHSWGRRPSQCSPADLQLFDPFPAHTAVRPIHQLSVSSDTTPMRSRSIASTPRPRLPTEQLSVTSDTTEQHSGSTLESILAPQQDGPPTNFTYPEVRLGLSNMSLQTPDEDTFLDDECDEEVRMITEQDSAGSSRLNSPQATLNEQHTNRGFVSLARDVPSLAVPMLSIPTDHTVPFHGVGHRRSTPRPSPLLQDVTPGISLEVPDHHTVTISPSEPDPTYCEQTDTLCQPDTLINVPPSPLDPDPLLQEDPEPMAYTSSEAEVPLLKGLSLPVPQLMEPCWGAQPQPSEAVEEAPRQQQQTASTRRRRLERQVSSRVYSDSTPPADHQRF